MEALPADAVRTIGTDCAVDFAPLLNYVELAPDANQTNGKPPQFTGVAARMDSKPVEQSPPAPVAVGRQGNQPRQPAHFTGVDPTMFKFWYTSRFISLLCFYITPGLEVPLQTPKKLLRLLYSA